MPNPDNTASPILVGGAGRSGTTWVLKVLGLHPDVQKVHENSLAYTVYREICASWWAQEFCREHCDGDPQRHEGVAMEAMREALCGVFPSSRARWVMKVIWGVESTWGVPLRVWAGTFPGARYIHCVRNPLDTLASMMAHLGKFSNMQSLAAAEQSYLRGHRDMLELAKLGFPCLRLRLEDVAMSAEAAWGSIGEFCNLTPFPIAHEELGRREAARVESEAMSAATEAPRLQWTDLSEATLEMARALGYQVPADCQGRAEAPELPESTLAQLHEQIACLANENLTLREELHAALQGRSAS